MSFFARLASRSYRRGLAAEAAGALEEAARAYAEAGRAQDVLRIRRLLAATTEDAAARLVHLRAALALARTAQSPSDDVAGIERDLARALLQSGADDPRALEEAAERFAAAGDHLGSADALLALGRISDARRALAEGRHFERLEEVDREEAERKEASHRLDAVLAEAKESHAFGRRAEALRALAGIEGASREEAAALAGRIASGRGNGRIGLALGGIRPLTCTAELPLVFGRGEGSPLPLRDPGISRHHARLSHDPEGGFVLEDLESRNGTYVDGIPIGAPFPLSAETGRFALGEQCRLSWRVFGPDAVLLTVERGLAAGARALALAGTIDLGIIEGGAPRGIRLFHARGWFILATDTEATLGARALPAAAEIELLAGDVIEAGGLCVEVRSH
jgi:hypothetical protein